MAVLPCARRSAVVVKSLVTWVSVASAVGSGQLERERVAVFVDNSGIDGRLGFFGECAFHKSQMPAGFSAALIASGHDFLPWSEFRFRRRL